MKFNKAIKNGPQEDVGRTAFHAASYGRRYTQGELCHLNLISN
jgi:hypothetical protein